MGGQVGLAGHINIPEGVMIGAQAGIGGGVKEGGVAIIGSPAFDVKDYYRSYAVFRKLPELRKQIMELENEVKDLKKKG